MNAIICYVILLYYKLILSRFEKLGWILWANVPSVSAYWMPIHLWVDGLSQLLLGRCSSFANVETEAWWFWKIQYSAGVIWASRSYNFDERGSCKKYGKAWLIAQIMMQYLSTKFLHSFIGWRELDSPVLMQQVGEN